MTTIAFEENEDVEWLNEEDVDATDLEVPNAANEENTHLPLIPLAQHLNCPWEEN